MGGCNYDDDYDEETGKRFKIISKNFRRNRVIFHTFKKWNEIIDIYIVGVVCDKWLLELTQEDNSCLRKNSFYGIYFYNLKKKLWGI